MNDKRFNLKAFLKGIFFRSSFFLIYTFPLDLAGVEKAGKVAEDLVIGTVFPLEGNQAGYGQEAIAAIELAFERLKALDPDTAKHIQIISLNDKSSQKGAVAAASELMQKRGHVLIGSALGPNTEALVAFAGKNSIPLIAVSQSSFSGASNPFVFRANYSQGWQGAMLAGFAVGELRKNKVAVLVNTSDRYANDIAESFAKSFRIKGGFPLKEVYSADAPNFRAGVAKILASDCDTILFPSSSAQEVEQFLGVLKAIPNKISILGGDRWDTTELRPKFQHNFPVSYFISPFSTLVERQEVTEFVSGFKQKTQRSPSMLAAASYDALLLAVDAFKRAGTGRAKEMVRTLKATRDLNGLLGQMSMGAENNLISTGVVLRSTSEGFKYYALVGP